MNNAPHNARSAARLAAKLPAAARLLPISRHGGKAQRARSQGTATQLAPFPGAAFQLNSQQWLRVHGGHGDAARQYSPMRTFCEQTKTGSPLPKPIQPDLRWQRGTTVSTGLAPP
eukprot:gene204-biopygen11578